MRHSPAAPSAFSPKPLGEDVRSYRFLSPVFGGGVEVDKHLKHADPVTPIRVPSIRGQLRFWWRACNPGRCRTSDELRVAEAKVFGSTAAHSPVAIRVIETQTPADLVVLEGKFGTRRGFEQLAYGAFPLRDSAPDNPRHGVLHDYGDKAFKVGFSCPESLKADLEAALWAWGHFGGLGGRLRRGFGALAQVSAGLQGVEEGWKKHVTGLDVPWPHLPVERERSCVVSGKFKGTHGIDAQQFLLGALREIRQGVTGRNRGNEKHPGRSWWPEPDAIRKRFGPGKPEHRERVTTVDAFPRAAFGTPIIFHFKDEREGDPPQTMLLPKGLGRLASRLVLRPHLGAGSRVEALALVLARHDPAAYVLQPVKKGRGRGGANEDIPVRTSVNEAEARELKPLNKSGKTFTDPIQRFLEEIR